MEQLLQQVSQSAARSRSSSFRAWWGSWGLRSNSLPANLPGHNIVQSNEGSTLTLHEFPQSVLRLVKGKVSDSTLSLYAACIRGFVQFTGDMPLIMVTPYHIETFMAHRLETVSAVRVNIEFRALRALFNRAAIYGMIKTNPTAGLKQARLPQQHPRALSRREFARLLSAIDSREYRVLAIVAVCTAMRAGEIAALRWADVDLSRGVVHLVNREGFHLKSLRPRDVPLSRRAVRELRSLPRRSERVFLMKRGGPYNTHTLSVRFKKYARLASLSEDLHFHSLRHSAATWMVESNVPLPFVRDILGHSCITTTMIYAHNTAEHLCNSVLKLDPIVSC